MSSKGFNPITVNFDQWDTTKLEVAYNKKYDKPVLVYDGYSPVNLSFVKKLGNQNFWTMYGIRKGQKYEIKKGVGKFVDEWDGKWSISMKMRDSADYTSDDKDEGAIICRIIDDIQKKLETYYNDQGGEYKVISPYSFTKIESENKKRKEKVIDMTKPLYIQIDCPFTVKSNCKKDKDGNIPLSARKLSLRTFRKTKNGLVESSPNNLCIEPGEFKQFNFVPNVSLYLTEGPSKDKIRVRLRVFELVYSIVNFQRESQFEKMNASVFNDMPDDEEESEKSKPCSFEIPNDEENIQDLSDDEDIIKDEIVLSDEEEKTTKKKSKKKTKKDVESDED